MKKSTNLITLVNQSPDDLAKLLLNRLSQNDEVSGAISGIIALMLVWNYKLSIRGFKDFVDNEFGFETKVIDFSEKPQKTDKPKSTIKKAEAKPKDLETVAADNNIVKGQVTGFGVSKPQ